MINYIVWDIDPTIIKGFEYFRWYGVCWALGIMAGLKILSSIYKEEGIPTKELDRLTLNLMVGIVVGARLGHVFFYEFSYYWEHPIEILPIRLEPTFQFTGLAGLASHGGLTGALIGLYVYHRRTNRPYLWMLDRLVVAGGIVGGFIRLGNLMNSEIVGIPTDVPWAFIVTRIDQIPRHPAQLYEALFYFSVSILTYFMWRSQKFELKPGFIFGLGLTLIFIQRFLIEFLKENQVSFEEGLALNMGQTLSIPMVLIGIGIMIWTNKRTDESK